MDVEYDTMNDNNSVQSLGSIINNETKEIYVYITHIFMNLILAIFGVGTNIINLAVFYKMGFKDSINVSFFSLALSDLFSCITAVWSCIAHNPDFPKIGLPFRPSEIEYVTAGYPHVIFIKISGCVTAFIAFERCLCVTFPLKVKNIITSRSVAIFILIIWIVIFGLYVPSLLMCRLAWKFYSHLNKTLLGIIFADGKIRLEQTMYPIRGVTLPLLTFFIITTCTIVLVVNLKNKTKWRNQATKTSDQCHVASSRDTKVASLVVFVSVFFIMSFTPHILTVLAMSMEPELNFGGRYTNMFGVLFATNYIFESTNASTNLFIYYFRSSNYKAAFDKIFVCNKAATKNN